MVYEGKVDETLLESAGLPLKEEVSIGVHESAFVDYTKAISVSTLATGQGDYIAVSHLIFSENQFPLGPVRPLRLIPKGLQVIHGWGPVTIWHGSRLWTVSTDNTTWMLIDAELSSDPVFLLQWENIGLGGPIEIHIDGGESFSTNVPGLWLDNKAVGFNYYLCKSTRNCDASLENQKYLKGELVEILQLALDQQTGYLALEPAKR